MRARNPRLALATVIGEGFLGRLAFGMVSFAFPLYAFALGVSIVEIGFLVSLRTVVSLALKPVAGMLADRWGVRNVYLAGSLARVVAVAVLLMTDAYLGLFAARALQGVSAAGRDVGSLSVIARDAQARIGSAYSWYTTAKHVGGVAGAAVAGGILTWANGSFDTLFTVVLALAALPMGAAWFGLREERSEEEPEVVAAPAAEPAAGRLASLLALAREVAGPGSVAMLVATSAYMVHGIFPVLATEYVGLTEAETGIVYSLSAAVFLVAGPGLGWLVDRFGSGLGVTWRAAANIGSSLLYLFNPTFAGLAVARMVDDSGKAAFRPAWAVVAAEFAAADPARRGRRLGALDTSQNIGEVIGPLLAGLLWQTGGVAALFGVRIAIAAVAEIAALRVFGELGRKRRQTQERIPHGGAVTVEADRAA
jgi:MFS transporter, DHA1 family, multidrug resistance protein